MFGHMNNQPGSAIRFTLNGERYELTRELVEARLVGVVPVTIRKHAVRINDTWYPVIQAFEIAAGVPRSKFISHTARRHLAVLGYEVRGEIDSRTAAPAAQPARLTPCAGGDHP